MNRLTLAFVLTTSCYKVTGERTECTHALYGVITTIFPVNKAVIQFVNENPLAGLVVVGDLKTNHAEWTLFAGKHDRITYLNPQDQKLGAYRSASIIPWNHFGRKSIGMLHAIACGAKTIYDFDDDNHLLHSLDKVPQMTRYIAHVDHHVFNPYLYFDAAIGGRKKFAWPRGFPLQFIRNSQTYISIASPSNCSFQQLAVIQSLANNDPDVDAIYRMTRPVPLNFEKENTILVSPRGVYTPWNAQAVLVTHPAFFGLLLPVTVTGRVSDIWRSYICTRLLWETDYMVSFSSPFVEQRRNPHSYIQDFEDENELYHKTDTILDVLSGWSSEGCATLDIAYLNLYELLVKVNILGARDKELAVAWVEDLKNLGYKWPPITRRHPTFAPRRGIIVDHRGSDVREHNNHMSFLVNIWQPPSSYCYKHSNGWKTCAGDHLLYAPSSTQNLYSRKYMCLQEPFCWKQLDWKNTDPPTWTCPRNAPMRFYDMSYHDAVMASAATTIETDLNVLSNTNHEVFLCNCKHGRPSHSDTYAYSFKACPREKDLENTWATKFSEAIIKRNERNYKNDEHFKRVDALIFGFGSSMWEHWIGLNKSLVLALWHVTNQHRCTHSASASTFQKIRDLAADSHNKHVLGSNTLYHGEYMRHYTGIRPHFMPATLIGAVKGITWKQARPHFIRNGPIPPSLITKYPDIVNLVRSPNDGNVEYTLSDLSKYAGVVYFPYSITNGKVVEQYAMNIPIFVPSTRLANEMNNDRTATYDPYCPKMKNTDHPARHPSSPYEFDPNVRINTNGPTAAPDVEFWLGFSDIYHWPCVAIFDSWEELWHLLQTADLKQMNACMIQANKWRRFEELQSWCWVIQHVAKNKFN